MFTSCCPAWVKFCEQKYPELRENISTCRSPQQMFGAVLKEEARNNKEDSRKTIVVSIMPCTAKKAEIRLYENIVDEEKGVYNEDGSINVNPNSLTVIKEAYVEPELEKYDKEDSFQFMRTGYFCLDSKDSTKEHMVFNRIVSLKSSYKPN